MLEYVEKNTRRDQVIAFSKPRVLSLLTGRRSIMVSREEHLRDGRCDYAVVVKAPVTDQIPFATKRARAIYMRFPVVYENSLEPCRPNPFNPETRITYRMAEPGLASLRIYDVAGRLVTTLVEEKQSAGEHEVVWDGQNGAGKAVGSGIYLMRLELPGFTRVRQMVLLR